MLAHVPARTARSRAGRVQFLDTIIGKMSGAPEEAADLASLAPGVDRGLSGGSLQPHPYRRRLRRPAWMASATWTPPGRAFGAASRSLSKRPIWQPFAEAKLYGHNAGHALAAYLVASLGLSRIDELRSAPGCNALCERCAMVEESGAALCRATPVSIRCLRPRALPTMPTISGRRMVNPYVRDTVARVGRDPARKLGWNDRLVGAMRLRCSAGVASRRYALGACRGAGYAGCRPPLRRLDRLGCGCPCRVSPREPAATLWAASSNRASRSEAGTTHDWRKACAKAALRFAHDLAIDGTAERFIRTLRDRGRCYDERRLSILDGDF